MNELIIKWSDKLGLEYVKNIIADFDFMEIEFYEDRNKKEVIDVFLMYEYDNRIRRKRIEEINNEIIKFDNMKSSIKNYIIDKLRNENKLVNFLKNKDRRVLGKINSICDINKEYNIVDNMKFEEEKRNRGNNIRVNLNN
tara:strand:- start:1643 stop:2062 length:420 start_codon:yes stop_codon:yes gene_type:complete